MNYWLMKTEPDVFSIDDLKACPKSTDSWDGIRNYQARNFMRDDMKLGDKILIYHSNAGKQTGVVGVAEVVREAYPDHTALDKKSKYFSAKATEDKNPWQMVDVKFVSKFKVPVLLSEMKEMKSLKDMKLLQKGSRLSIMPVLKSEFNIITKKGK